MPKWYLVGYEPFAGKRKGHQSIESFDDRKVARILIFIQNIKDSSSSNLERAITDYKDDAEIVEVEIIYPLSCTEAEATVCRLLGTDLFSVDNHSIETRLTERFVQEYYPNLSNSDLSADDYRLRFQEARKMPIARDLMIKPPRLRVVDPETNLYRAWMLMLGRGIGHLPVVASRNNMQLKGMISQTDLYRFTPPDIANLPEEDKDLKEDVMSRYPVTYERVFIKDPLCVVENAEIEEVVKILALAKTGSNISLVPVVSDEQTKTVVGVLSYVEIMRAWAMFSKKSEAGSKKSGEVGTSYQEIMRFSIDHNVAFAVSRLTHLRQTQKNTTHSRHIVVCSDKEKNIPVSLLDEREIQPFLPLEEADSDSQDEAYHQTRLGDITPRFPLDQIKISADIPIWNDDPNAQSVVGIFLKSLEGKDKNWIDRKTGLLVCKNDGTPVKLITPTDCIRLLIS